MMNVADGKIDNGIAVTGRANLVPGSGGNSGMVVADEVRISWTTSGDPDCVWIQRAAPGEEFTAIANFVLRPNDAGPVDRPGPFRGQYCYRFFVVSELGRSQPSTSCVEVTVPSLPLGPSDMPAPPSTGSGSSNSNGLAMQLGLLGMLLMAVAVILVRTAKKAGDPRE